MLIHRLNVVHIQANTYIYTRIKFFIKYSFFLKFLQNWIRLTMQNLVRWFKSSKIGTFLLQTMQLELQENCDCSKPKGVKSRVCFKNKQLKPLLG